MKWHNFRKQAFFVMIILVICNIIPTCAGDKSGIAGSFAMPAPSFLPKIVDFSPQAITGKEGVFVYVTGMGFEKGSQLVINGFTMREKYMKVVDSESLIVKVPRGIPKGKYLVIIKNPDGKTSNEVCFEVKG